MKTLLCTLGAAVLLSGCATLKLTEGGEKVRMLAPAEVSSCKQLGRTNASVTAKLVFDRPEGAVAEELETVARNSAANMNGDTIVPLTVIEDGKQTFIVYKCINPDG